MRGKAAGFCNHLFLQKMRHLCSTILTEVALLSLIG
jgi:hypothetical protein